MALKIGNQYIIQFGGLKEGSHNFEIKLDKKFFEDNSDLEAESRNIKVTIELLKKPNLLTFNISIRGNISLCCDVCLDKYDQKINYSDTFYVKFSDKEEEDSDEIIFLHPDKTEIDLQHYLYESISLNIPVKKVHEEKDGKPGCNKEMLKRLNELSYKGTENKNNPLQDQLKKLFDNKNLK